MDEQTALMDHGAPGDDAPPPPPHDTPLPWYRVPVARDRSRSKVGGVVSGVCRAYGFDLRTTRIAVAIAAIVLPLVLFAYVLAWIVLPEQPEAAMPLQDLVRDRRRLPLFIAVGIVSLAIGLGSLGSWLLWGGFPWGIGLIALGILLWVAPSMRPRPTDTPWAPPTGPLATGPQATTPVATGPGTALVGPVPATDTARRRRIPVVAMTVIAVFAYAGITAVGDQAGWWDASVLPTIVVCVIALAVSGAVSALVNRRFGTLALVPPLAVVAAGLLVTSPNLDGGGVGERSIEPSAQVTTIDEHLAMGELTIDLRSVPSLDGVVVDAEVGLGRIHVIVPDDVNLELDTQVNAGHAVLNGDPIVEGLRQRDRRTLQVNGADDSVTLRLSVGAGEIAIDRSALAPIAPVTTGN